MRVELPRRTVSAGARLDVLVLAAGGSELIGVDLASGAFVRAAVPHAQAPLAPFDVVRAELADGDPLWSPHAPESVELASPLEPLGRLRTRRAEHYLRRLLDPGSDPLLGFAGPAVPFWTLAGDRPSLALVAPSAGPAVAGDRHGFRCRFVWRGRQHDLPLFDARLIEMLEQQGRWRSAGASLHRLLGYRPARALVALSAPHRGHCYKVVAALLPRG